MSDTRTLSMLTVDDLEKIVGKQIELSMAQLELRLVNQFATRSQVEANTAAIKLVQENAVMRNGPLMSNLRDMEKKVEEHEKTLLKGDIVKDQYVPKVDQAMADIENLKTWRTRLAGAILLVGPIATITFGVVLDRIIH